MGFSKRKLIFIFFVLNLLFVTKYSLAISQKEEPAIIVANNKNQTFPSFVKNVNLSGTNEVNSVDSDAGCIKCIKLSLAVISECNIRIYRQPEFFQLFYLPLNFDLPPP